MPELKIGSSGDEVYRFHDHFQKWAKSYANLMGNRDGYFGNDERSFVIELQKRLKMPQTGIFGDTEAIRTGYRFQSGNRPNPKDHEHRPIWAYSAPGSGADWWMGPPFDLGEWIKKDFNINHQPVGYPKGGYLGLMGGDPQFSYNDIIGFEKAELRRLILANPDLKNPNLEFWFFAYSQSADGMKVAIAELFGEGGEFANLRSRINGLILFGDPTRNAGPTKVGNNPKGWGISRKVFPKWVNDLTWSITTHFDMYACTTDDTLLPLFYEWFVKAETELPFVAYCAGIILPAIASYFNLATPVLAGLGQAPIAIIASLAGLSMTFVGQLVASYGGGESPNPELVKALSAQGLLMPSGISKVIKTLAALPGIQTHGEYYLDKPEFGGRSGLLVGYDIVKNFRR